MTVHPLEVIGDRPKKRPQQQPPPNANWLLLGVVIFFAVMAYKYFSDGFQKQDGKWVIKEEFKEHVEKKRVREKYGIVKKGTKKELEKLKQDILSNQQDGEAQ